jgi:hypothetical protein
MDEVNHPEHYTFGNIEVLDAIEDWQLGYHLGNAVKYIARAGRKAGSSKEVDLKKAVFYLQRYINGHGVNESWLNSTMAACRKAPQEKEEEDMLSWARRQGENR